MNKFICFFLSLFFSHILVGSDIADTYINKYKYIAIAEMERTGIPASIKLAQGLLESDWGRSDLATQANNHFGIKCGNYWDGGTYFKMDDEKDPSCFRVFNSPEASYLAHSEFLTSESKSGRYDFLFDYDRTNYKAWAKGLRKAGYATDRSYPRKLIEIIEKYQLYQYDSDSKRTSNPEYVEEKEENQVNDIVNNTPLEEYTGSRLKYPEVTTDFAYTIRDYTFNRINEVRHTFALGGETLQQLAVGTGSSVKELMKYNEEYGYENLILPEGAIVFLKKKQRSYKGDQEYHVVSTGESMFYISQLYGIRLENLYGKNKMPQDAEPLVGEKIYLKKLPSKEDRPAYTKQPRRPDKTEYLFDE